MGSFSKDAPISLEDAAKAFAAIGSGPRLEVLLLLINTRGEGLTIGDIQKHTNIPASTLAHHLRFLLQGNLITQEKIGREVFNKANFSSIKPLADFLLGVFENERSGEP